MAGDIVDLVVAELALRYKRRDDTPKIILRTTLLHGNSLIAVMKGFRVISSALQKFFDIKKDVAALRRGTSYVQADVSASNDKLSLIRAA